MIALKHSLYALAQTDAKRKPSTTLDLGVSQIIENADYIYSSQF